MPVAVAPFKADSVVLAVAVHHAQLDARRHDALGGCGDFLRRHQAVLIRLQDVQVRVAAVEVASVLQRKRRALRRGGGDEMVHVKVRNRPAVADEVPLKPPFAAQDLADELSGPAAGLAVHAVVGAHDGLHVRLLHQRLERGQVGLPKVLVAYARVELVTQALRPECTAMCLAHAAALR